jgi:hypothetical protein
MPTPDQVSTWVEGYVRAWNTNDPAEIGDLFGEDAVYRTEPYRPGIRGRDAIVADWLDRRDEPGETGFTWQPLAVTDDVAVVQGETVYRTPPRTYSNLWVIRLDEAGRCTEFTEWWMEHDQSG